MVSAASVEADEKEFACGVAEVFDCILATRDWILERESDAVELAVGDAHAPDEFSDVLDVFLMGFWGKDDKGSPWTIAFLDPSVGYECLLLLEDDCGFVWPVIRFTAAYGLGVAGVNREFEAQDGFANTHFVEDVPVFHDE
jgi:hypothetical protein